MSAWLLDINVLIARQDADHQHHESVARWMHAQSGSGWATCPITENGFVRILGQPTYPGWPGTPQLSATALRQLIETIPGHEFLPDEVSILDPGLAASFKDVAAREVTDLYLLALAVHHGVRFATMDARINASLISGGAKAYYVIPTT